jgi:hypothetical protein
VLEAGERLTLAVDCANTGGQPCNPGALLLGVLRVASQHKP